MQIANKTAGNLFADNYFTITHFKKNIFQLQLALADNQTNSYITLML